MPRPTTTGVFHQYLEMIGSTEPMTKKAGFWCSYVRGLGGYSIVGSEAIVAREKAQSCSSRKSGGEEKSAKERVREPGYCYAPLYRNIYGHSPRKTGLKSIYAGR